MRGAADRCMNIGLCRKASTGVMCPSYMATRDEEHSTRGRANALLYALSAAGPARGARQRAAARHPGPLPGMQGVQERVPARGGHGRAEDRERSPPTTISTASRCARACSGRIRTLNRLGSAAFPLSNLAAGWRPARLLAERWLGISAARPLPRFHRQDLRSWFRRRPAQATPASQGEVIFLADSFTTFTEPAVGTGGHRTAGARRLAGPPRGRGLLRPGQPVQGAGRPGPADGDGHGRATG